MKGKRQQITRDADSELRAEVNEHVFLLNQAVSKLRLHVCRTEEIFDDLADPDPRLDECLAATRHEIDLIYRTMVRVRWAALKT